MSSTRATRERMGLVQRVVEPDQVLPWRSKSPAASHARRRLRYAPRACRSCDPRVDGAAAAYAEFGRYPGKSLPTAPMPRKAWRPSSSDAHLISRVSKEPHRHVEAALLRLRQYTEDALKLKSARAALASRHVVALTGVLGALLLGRMFHPVEARSRWHRRWRVFMTLSDTEAPLHLRLRMLLMTAHRHGLQVVDWRSGSALTIRLLLASACWCFAGGRRDSAR